MSENNKNQTLERQDELTPQEWKNLEAPQSSLGQKGTERIVNYQDDNTWKYKQEIKPSQFKQIAEQNKNQKEEETSKNKQEDEDLINKKPDDQLKNMPGTEKYKIEQQQEKTQQNASKSSQTDFSEQLNKGQNQYINTADQEIERH